MRYENLHIPFFDSNEFLLDIIHWYEKEELQVTQKIQFNILYIKKSFFHIESEKHL